jgi:hypothetical protein
MAKHTRYDIILPQIKGYSMPFEWRNLKNPAWKAESQAMYSRGVWGCSGNIEARRIDHKSCKPLRTATAKIARLFQVEFNYDFLQYSADEIENKRDRVWLLTTPALSDYQIGIGAICFRYREYTKAPHEFALAWLWLAPQFRSKGILSSYWESLRGLYGDFPCEQPLSKAMNAFLKTRGECYRCGRECKADTCPVIQRQNKEREAQHATNTL